ncbi:MAG: hypothetical protein DRP66_00470 [Planctomycetota bacterium]|nr:MAG: hypothetical protein DRP66_00470 [Planctomycetota bacterium]
MNKSYKAYSLVELIIVVMFIGILAAISVPRIDFAIVSKQKLDTVAQKIAVDLRRTRRLAIADAANNSNGFEMKMKGSQPYSGYEIENRETNEIVDSLTIDSDISCTGGDTFEFGPMGNLTDEDCQLQVAAQGRSFTITIIPATGMVKCVEN